MLKSTEIHRIFSVFLMSTDCSEKTSCCTIYTIIIKMIFTKVPFTTQENGDIMPLSNKCWYKSTIIILLN